MIPQYSEQTLAQCKSVHHKSHKKGRRRTSLATAKAPHCLISALDGTK